MYIYVRPHGAFKLHVYAKNWKTSMYYRLQTKTNNSKLMRSKQLLWTVGNAWKLVGGSYLQSLIEVVQCPFNPLVNFKTLLFCLLAPKLIMGHLINAKHLFHKKLLYYNVYKEIYI